MEDVEASLLLNELEEFKPSVELKALEKEEDTRELDELVRALLDELLILEELVREELMLEKPTLEERTVTEDATDDEASEIDALLIGASLDVDVAICSEELTAGIVEASDDNSNALEELLTTKLLEACAAGLDELLAIGLATQPLK